MRNSAVMPNRPPMQMEPTASYMELPVMCEMPVEIPAPQPLQSLRGLMYIH